MKVAYYLFFVTITACQTAAVSESGAEATNSYNEFTLHKGTNISLWLSQSSRWGEERRVFFTEDDCIQQ